MSRRDKFGFQEIASSILDSPLLKTFSLNFLKCSLNFDDTFCMIQKHPILVSVILASLLFSLAVLVGHQPFIADDWWWLWLPLNNPALSWTEPYPFSRMPISVLFTMTSLKLGLWESSPRFWLIVFFSVHVFAFSLLLKTLFERSKLNLTPHSTSFILSCVLFGLLSTNYEIHLWHICSMHALGALFIALSFRVKHLVLRILLSSLGLLEYDTFVFLLVGFSILTIFVDRIENPFAPVKKEEKQIGIIVYFSGVLSILTKLTLGQWLGFLQRPPFEENWITILKNFKFLIRTLWTIHFYKTNWLFTLIELLGLIALIFLVYKKRLIAPKKLAGLLIIPTLSALPLCLNTYLAPRAYYGPQILQGLVFSFLLGIVFTYTVARTYSWIIPVVLFASSHLVQWAYTLSIKNQNYQTLLKTENRILQQMDQCLSPCLIDLPPPNEGIKKDWVLPELAWLPYYERIRLLHFPKKNIQIRIIKKK